MPPNNKDIFLAGSTGMVGSSILRRLVCSSKTIHIKASCHNLKPQVLSKQIEYIKGDLKSIKDCRRMVRGSDCAIMAAAFAGGARFIRQFPWEHMKENLMLNMQMLEAFRLEKVKRVIFIGSAALYQDFEGYIQEDKLDFNKDPNSVYFGFAWAMRFIEKLCLFLHQQYGMEVVIVRAANIFGPYDKFSPDTSNFIPALIRKAVDKMDPFEVWGSPDVTRDVLYADDFADAVVKLIRNNKITYDVFNIGSGVKTSVGDVVKWVLDYTGHRPKDIKYIQDKPTTIKFRALDCSKAERVLGWQPRHTIPEGINKTIQWWAKYKETWSK